MMRISRWLGRENEENVARTIGIVVVGLSPLRRHTKDFYQIRTYFWTNYFP